MFIVNFCKTLFGKGNNDYAQMLQKQETKSYSSFEISVENILKVPIEKLSDKKQAIYIKLVSSLLDEEKQMTKMVYIRCKPNSEMPKINHKDGQSIILQKLNVQQTEDGFQYNQNLNPEATLEWYLNFADERLFGFYFSDLFAQDEIQCAEHPALCHIQSLALQLGSSYKPLTIEEYWQNTPILIKNAHRLGYVDISPSQECPRGLYGRQFQNAKFEDIEKRIHLLHTKTTTNLIAMAALDGRSGEYSKKDIAYTFQTAYKAFATAVNNSSNKLVNIHTGNWGCGAFGNNYQLICLVQLFAAHLAGVNTLFYHTYNKQGTDQYNLGQQLYTDFIEELNLKVVNHTIQKQDFTYFNELFLDFALKQKFRWGKSDGN